MGLHLCHYVFTFGALIRRVNSKVVRHLDTLVPGSGDSLRKLHELGGLWDLIHSGLFGVEEFVFGFADFMKKVRQLADPPFNVVHYFSKF